MISRVEKSDKTFNVPTIIIAWEEIRSLVDMHGLGPKSEWTRSFQFSVRMLMKRRIFELGLAALGEDGNDDAAGFHQEMARAVAEEIVGGKRASDFLTRTVKTVLFNRRINARSMQIEFGQRDGQPVTGNLVFSPSEDLTCSDMIRLSLACDEDTSFTTGIDGEQCREFIRRHEYAHGARAGEGQADKMSAISCRRAFADATFIKLMADMRAVSILLDRAPQEENVVLAHHWGTVQALDYVVSLDDAALNAITEEQIRSLPQEMLGEYVIELEELGKILYDEHPEACEKRDLPAILLAARQVFAPCLESDAPPLNAHETIARRFIEGLERIVNMMKPA